MVNKQTVLVNILKSHGKSLAVHTSREQLARQINEALSLWSFHETKSFVDEMRGLNLSRSDDRQAFVDFFCCWIPLGGDAV